MNVDSSQVMTSAVVVAVAILLKFVTYRVLRGITKKFKFKAERRAVTSKVINISILSLAGLILLGIWEVDPNDLTLYIASIFTVIGVAFFAQWSHLSNITASVILFTNHQVGLGDKVTIHDSDNQIEGKIVDIGLFFMTVVSADGKKTIISNSMFMQKIISVKPMRRLNDESSEIEVSTTHIVTAKS